VQDAWGVITTVAGTIGAYRRAALTAIGGVSDDTPCLRIPPGAAGAAGQPDRADQARPDELVT
jgi:hypothetical protein